MRPSSAAAGGGRSGRLGGAGGFGTGGPPRHPHDHFRRAQDPKIGLAAKIAAAPLLLAMEPKMASAILVEHKTAIFEQMARQQPDWTEAEVSRLVKAYGDGKLKPVMEEMQADARKHMPKEAASQRGSAPASQPGSAPE